MGGIGAAGARIPEVDGSDDYGIINSTAAEIGTHVWSVDYFITKSVGPWPGSLGYHQGKYG